MKKLNLDQEYLLGNKDHLPEWILYRMPKYKGWGPWKCIWLSPCSGHRINRSNCPRCSAGYWQNCWTLFLSQQLHDCCYPLWFYWKNRKWPWDKWEK